MTRDEPPAAQTPRPELPVLAEVELTADTTLDDLVRMWGPPRPAGPAAEMLAYRLASGEQLWLSFTAEAPRKLVRAIVLTGYVSPTTRTLLNELEITRTRQRDQIDRCRRLTPRDVYAVWGPPDNVGGSGIQRWEYRMANGDEIGVAFIGGVTVPLHPRRPNCENSYSD